MIGRIGHISDSPSGDSLLYKRLATNCRWKDIESEFGRHICSLAKIFYRTVNIFHSCFANLVENLNSSFLVSRAPLYSSAILKKEHCRRTALDSSIALKFRLPDLEELVSELRKVGIKDLTA